MRFMPTELDGFSLQQYRALRDRELELNRATAAFERAVLETLFVLNGGAPVAALTLLGINQAT